MGTVTPINEGPRFPDGYQGAGPMYAAIPLGDRFYDLAISGAVTYSVEWDSPDGSDGCAFLDKGQAELAADARNEGYYYTNDGLTAHLSVTPGTKARESEALSGVDFGPEISM